MGVKDQAVTLCSGGVGGLQGLSIRARRLADGRVSRLSLFSNI